MHFHYPSSSFSSNNLGLHDHISRASQPFSHISRTSSRVEINASRVYLELTSMTTNFPTKLELNRSWGKLQDNTRITTKIRRIRCACQEILESRKTCGWKTHGEN
jgi:hypothetical protein